MLEKSFGLLFFLKQPKSRKSDVRYVYLRITVDGHSKELSTKRIWHPDRWNQSSGRAIGTKEDARSLNAYLDALCAQIYQAKVKLIELNKPVTAENLKNHITGQGNDRKKLLEIFKEHNLQMEASVGKEYVFATLQRYRTAHDHVEAFIQWKYQTTDIDNGWMRQTHCSKQIRFQLGITTRITNKFERFTIFINHFR